MSSQCKVIKFPTMSNVEHAADITGGISMREKALLDAIEQIAGYGALMKLRPLIIKYRVACDLNGYAEGIELMEQQYSAHGKQKNGLATN